MIFDKVEFFKKMDKAFGNREYYTDFKSKYDNDKLYTYDSFLDSIKYFYLNKYGKVSMEYNTYKNGAFYKEVHRDKLKNRKEIKESLPKGSKLIYQVVTGSQSFGLSTATSDTDIKGIYIQPDVDHGCINTYVPSVTINKDEIYFEVKRFVELLIKGDATALEMLFSPKYCIGHITPEGKSLRRNRDLFVTKNLYWSYYNYATTQLSKATNYNRMANWDKEKVRRKDVSEFCHIRLNDGRTMQFKKYLIDNNISDDRVALTKQDNFVNTFVVYIDTPNPRAWYTDNSNELRTSEIPLENIKDFIGVLHFNHSDYSKHCKEYRKYQDWLVARSDVRYNTNLEHGQHYDAKNLMHTIRLIMTSMEIPIDKRINVKRTKEREYLLNIKSGLLDLKTEIDHWMEKSKNTKELFDNSDLKKEVNLDDVHELLYQIRRYFNNQNFKLK